MTTDEIPPGRPDDDRVTPRRYLNNAVDDIDARRRAVKSILNSGRQAPKQTEHYLRGYADALELATAEVRQVANKEIMGITPGDDDE